MDLLRLAIDRLAPGSTPAARIAALRSKLRSEKVASEDLGAVRTSALQLGAWDELAAEFPAIFSDAYTLRSAGQADQRPILLGGERAAGQFIDPGSLKRLVGKDVVVKLQDWSGTECVVAGRLAAVAEDVDPQDPARYDLRFEYLSQHVPAQGERAFIPIRDTHVPWASIKGYRSAVEAAPIKHLSGARGLMHEDIRTRAAELMRGVYRPRIDLGDPSRYLLRDEAGRPITNDLGLCFRSEFVDAFKVERSVLSLPLAHELITRFLAADLSDLPLDGADEGGDSFKAIRVALKAKAVDILERLVAEIRDGRAPAHLILAYENLDKLVQFQKEVLLGTRMVFSRRQTAGHLLAGGMATALGAFENVARLSFALHRARDRNATAEQMLATFQCSFPLVLRMAAADLEVFSHLLTSLGATEEAPDAPWYSSCFRLAKTTRGLEVQFDEGFVADFRAQHGCWIDTIQPGTTKCPANYGLNLDKESNAILRLQQSFAKHLLAAFRTEIEDQTA
jgi:hypothetical protein